MIWYDYTSLYVGKYILGVCPFLLGGGSFPYVNVSIHVYIYICIYDIIYEKWYIYIYTHIHICSYIIFRSFRSFSTYAKFFQKTCRLWLRPWPDKGLQGAPQSTKTVWWREIWLAKRFGGLEVDPIEDVFWVQNPPFFGRFSCTQRFLWCSFIQSGNISPSRRGGAPDFMEMSCKREMCSSLCTYMMYTFAVFLMRSSNLQDVYDLTYRSYPMLLMVV